MTGCDRVRPDADLVLADLFRAGLPARVLFAPNRPVDYLSRLPLVTARAVSPGSFAQSRNVRRRWSVGIDVSSYAEERQAASDLDDLALRVLFEAFELGTPAAGAYLSGFEIDVPGSEVRAPDQPSRLFRWSASYSLRLRPA